MCLVLASSRSQGGMAAGTQQPMRGCSSPEMILHLGFYVHPHFAIPSEKLGRSNFFVFLFKKFSSFSIQ